MADDVRLKYLDLIRTEKETRLRFLALERMISDVSTALSSYPFEFSFTNIDTRTPYRVTSNRMIDGRIWPTADQIQDALVKWFVAREEAGKVWAKLSEQDRHGLTPPVGFRAS